MGMVTGAAPTSRRRRLGVTWHVLTGLLLVGAVLAQIFRPLAPDLGAVPDPGIWFDPHHLARVARYQRPRYVGFGIATALRVLVPVLIACSWTGRRVVERVAGAVGPARPGRAAAAVTVTMLVATDVAVLPVSFWLGFLHEGAYGFRTQGLAGWCLDWVLAAAPVWVTAAMLALGGFTLIARLPRLWPVAAAVTGGMLTVAGVFAAPVLLEPLRFDLRPLTDVAVRAEVGRVTAAAGYDVDTILVADASRRTTKANAYVSGLGATRRIVLYDTLLTRPADEVGVVLAHELAHDRNGDLWRGTALGVAGVVATVYLIVWLVRRRTDAGRGARGDDPRTVATIIALIAVANLLATPVVSAVSRRAEAAADLGALAFTQDPHTFLRMTEGLARANLADPSPPPWYRLWAMTHPPVASRLELGTRWPFPDSSG